MEKLNDCGIVCNLFYADTDEDYRKYFEMGIDIILTNSMDLAVNFKKDIKEII